jgi:hypothetical protein
VRHWNRCRLHLFLLEASEFGSTHYEGLGSQARLRCVADLSMATLLFSLSNGTAAEPYSGVEMKASGGSQPIDRPYIIGPQRHNGRRAQRLFGANHGDPMARHLQRIYRSTALSA